MSPLFHNLLLLSTHLALASSLSIPKLFSRQSQPQGVDQGNLTNGFYLTTYTDNACQQAPTNVTYLYYAEAKANLDPFSSYTFSRALVEGEQVDFNNANCTNWIGNATYGWADWTFADTTICNSLPDGLSATCVNMWHH